MFQMADTAGSQPRVGRQAKPVIEAWPYRRETLLACRSTNVGNCECLLAAPAATGPPYALAIFIVADPPREAAIRTVMPPIVETIGSPQSVALIVTVSEKGVASAASCSAMIAALSVI